MMEAEQQAILIATYHRVDILFLKLNEIVWK